MTGMILDDSFTNVKVKNGKVISDGDKNMVVGVAMPGLKDSLKVTSSDFSEDIDIPEYVEVTADVKDFSMDMTMSVMLSGITSSDNVEDFVDLSDLDDAIDTLSDSSSQLADGTKELREGLEQLRSKVPALADGANTLNSSTESLRNGVSSLDATLNTAMTEEEKAAASKQASETVDAQADSIKKQAADTVASQKESIEKQASATVDAQAEAIKKQAADTVAAQQAEIAKQAEALVTAQEADIKSQADQLVDAEAGNIQKLAAAAVKAEFDAGQRQAIEDQAKATTTSTVSAALKGNAQLLPILKAGIKANEAATIHIGLAPSTVSMMAKQFKIYAVKHPEIHFDIHEGSTFTLKDQLENRVVDITTLRTPISVNGYASHILMTDELCAMSVLQEKWGENGVLTLEQLSGEPLILSHRYRGFLLSAFERKGLSVDIYYECEDARTAMTLAENGLGIAILPASMRPLADKCFVYKIDSDELITEVLLAWNKEKVTDEIKEFLEFLFNQFD